MRPPATLRLVLLLAWALLLLAPLAARADDADKDRSAVIDERVQRAETTFEQSVAKARADLADDIQQTLDRAISKAADDGDLAELEQLQQQLQSFKRNGTTPTHPAAKEQWLDYHHKRARLGDALVRTYDSVQRQYTQLRDLDNAKLIQEKIEWLRPLNHLETVQWKGRQYMLVREQTSWTQAQAECKKLGGYLACLNDKAEHRFLIKEVLKNKPTLAWLGATDTGRDGKWHWLDETADYWPWNPGEPNNAKRGAQLSACFNKDGTLSDLPSTHSLVVAYICEWDYVPTRETVHQSESSTEIKTLQAATLKHNELVVGERKRLQSLILDADTEQSIADARADYQARVTAIKRHYIQQLESVLKNAIKADRLVTAGNIKTQILRVEKQLAQLSEQDAQPDAPALDAGDETASDPQPAENDDEDGRDNEEDPTNDASDTFIGIPLE